MNPLKQVLSAFTDDTGAVSMMRVILFMVACCVLVPKLVLAVKTGATPTWTTEDMEMLGIALGGKLWQNNQENSSPATPLKAP